MKNLRTEQWVRLGLGTALNILLWQVVHIGKVNSSIDREFRDTMLSAVIGAFTLVCVVPLFWRGELWQAPLAFVLIPLPGFALFIAVAFAVTHL